MTTTTEETKRLRDLLTGKINLKAQNVTCPAWGDFIAHAVNNIVAVSEERDALKLEVERLSSEPDDEDDEQDQLSTDSQRWEGGVDD